MAVINFIASRQVIRDFSIRDHKKLTRFLANNIESNFTQHLQQLDQLSKRITLEELSPAQAKLRLQAFLDFENIFWSIHYYQPKGDLLFAVKRAENADYKPESNIYNVPDQPIKDLFRRVLREKRKRLSPIIKTKEGFIYQAYFVPVLNQQGDVTGMMGGAISPTLSRYDYLTKGLNLSKENFFALVGQEAGVISSEGIFEDEALMERLNGDFFSHPEAGIQMKIWQKEGQDFLVFYQFIPSLKYWLIFGLADQLIESKVRGILRWTFLAFIALFVFCLIVANFLGTRLSAPISRVTQSLKSILLGDFSQQVSYSKEDEIGYLCHLTNLLAAKIQKEKALGEFWSDEEELLRIKQGEKISEEV